MNNIHQKSSCYVVLVGLEKCDKVGELPCLSPVPIPLPRYLLLRLSHQFWFSFGYCSPRYMGPTPLKSSCLYRPLIPETLLSLSCSAEATKYHILMVTIFAWSCFSCIYAWEPIRVVSLVYCLFLAQVIYFSFHRLKISLVDTNCSYNMKGSGLIIGITETTQEGRYFCRGGSHAATNCTLLVQSSTLRDSCSVALALNHWL